MWYENIKWLLIGEIAYLIIVCLVCLRVIVDTRAVTKTIAYLLLVVFVPVFGIVFYFSFGINYRKRKMFNKKTEVDESFKNQLLAKQEEFISYLTSTHTREVEKNKTLITLLSNPKTSNAYLLPENEVTLLKNGEEFFPLLLKELKKAKQHIHIEYYIFEDGTRGNQVKEILIEKAKQGVKVRFIYDDFGSKDIRRSFVNDLKTAGVEAYPFNKIKLMFLANRLNYRNHRKIVIIDKETSFTGGINVADKYDNSLSNEVYWRDTHIMIKGYGSTVFQQIFISDWNFCSCQNLTISEDMFPLERLKTKGNTFLQVISSGPDYDLPNILFSVLEAINGAKKEILLTTPYYIPDETLQNALIVAALSGVDVKLLVPKNSDSLIVNMASQSYFGELLEAGVKIYEYTKGFIHAKTFVTDRTLASIGTANLDLRSFDLNFEVSTLIYDERIATELTQLFFDDLKDSEEITLSNWKQRGKTRKLLEKVVRLLSPFL